MAGRQAGADNNAGRLSKIEEQDGENAWPTQCEACKAAVTDEDDIAMCQDISRQLETEENLRNAYNNFRKLKDLG